MTPPTRGWSARAAVTAASAAAALAFVVLEVRAESGVSAVLAVMALLTATAVVGVVLSQGLVGSALGLLALSLATSSWNAVSLGPLKLTHVALAAALALLLATTTLRGRSVWAPVWVWILGAAITLSAILTYLFPPSPAYFSRRYVEDIPDAMGAIGSLGTASVAGAAQWLVAAVGLPLAVVLAVTHRDDGRMRRLIALTGAWLAGVGLNALAALADLSGAGISVGMLGMPDQIGRQAGLSVHPNHLAVAVVMALPVVLWGLVRARTARTRAIACALGVLMLAALSTTGSRAGFAGGVLAVAVMALVERRTRRLVPVVAGASVLIGLLALVVVPGLLASAARHLRLVGAETADESDAIRAGYAGQAIADFQHAPWHGVGFEIVVQGHDIYLQLLASGGVILLLCYLLAQLGFLIDSWSTRDRGLGLGRALAVAGGTFLVVGTLQNQLTDVFTAVPFALAAGVRALDAPLPVVTSAQAPQLLEVSR